MNYAFWIAIAVVFIAIAPAIIKGRRANRPGGGDTVGTTGAIDHRRDDPSDRGDADGGDGGGD